MKSILIRAEDKNIWEARTPLVPEDLKELIEKNGVKVWVEESGKRFFKREEFEKAGAAICTDMSRGDIILGVKEIPEKKLLDDKIYVFFSHTIKGQPYNMHMLRRIMAGGSTLIDYERVADEHDRRLVYFGHYAGDAGAINILWLMGEYWRHHGIETPFASCRQAKHYRSVSEAMDELKQMGERIRSDGLPSALAPLVIGIMGYGNVSEGAQSIFDCLPVKRIAPDELADFIDGCEWDNRTVYVTVFREEDMVRRRDGADFLLEDYYNNPEKYEGHFARFLPMISILVNATYWDERYPRFVTWEDLRKLSLEQERTKLQGIADITCDVNGSIECNVKTTDSGMPAYLVDPVKKCITDGHKGEGIVLLAVDNLPAELPNDASAFFSSQLKPLIPGLAAADFSGNLDSSGLPDEIKRAVIVYNGELTPPYGYLKQYLGISP